MANGEIAFNSNESVGDKAEAEPCDATSGTTLNEGLDYWTSFSTACCAWFACWRAAMPVDCSTLY